MKIIISNLIEIIEPTKEVKDYCRNELTIKNPDYDKKRRMGIWLANTPREIKLYDVNGNIIYVPIGCFKDIWKIHPYKEDYKDYSVKVKANIKSNIQLRNYQKPCLDAVEGHLTGLLILPAGTGKTVTALQCAYDLGQKTLWLTHTQDLLNQAKEECENNMTCKTSVITKGKCDYSGDIVFATIQTLVNVIDKEEIPQDTFGLVIGDEIQHYVVSANSVMQFQKCISYFASRYKIGLTATLHTANGLHKTIPKLIGDVIYELKKEDGHFVGYYEGDKVVSVPCIDFQIPAQVFLIKTKYDVTDKDVYSPKNGTIQFSSLISDLSEDKERNDLILKLLKNIKGSTIIVSDRTKQLKELADNFGSNAAYVDGTTKKQERENNLNLVREGRVKYLFASYKLIAEGFNAPILENLVMATPVKDLRILIQSVGRIQRPYKGKKIANVYDLGDNVIKLEKFLKERKRIYKREGWKINDTNI